jgi:ATP-dependent Clp protease adaptor protein ClpS
VHEIVKRRGAQDSGKSVGGTGGKHAPGGAQSRRETNPWPGLCHDFGGISLMCLFSHVQDRLYRSLRATTGATSSQVMSIEPIHMSADDGDDSDMGVALKTRAKTKRPPLYKVLLLNDDYTPMEFVVHILERFFGMTHAQAFEIMLTVHKKGVAVVGVFSHEIAETKVTQVMDFARRHQHPLQCTMEKE